MSQTARHFEATRIVPLSLEKAWRLLSNTDLLNRNIGLKEVAYSPPVTDGEGLLYRPATSHIAGIKVSWREYPFQWEAEYRYSVRRVYHEGPLESVEGGVELSPAGNSCRVRLFAEAVPANAVGGLLAGPIIERTFRKTFTYCETEAQRQKRENTEVTSRESVDERLLDQLAARLFDAPVDGAYARALVEHLRRGYESDVAELRPFAWARANRLEREEALRACLHAVRAGLLNLRWSLMCPHCRVSKQDVTTLADVGSNVFCDVCGISYGVNFDRYVELRFSPQPSIRKVEANTYCLSGPFRSPHIVSQVQIDAGQERELKLPESLYGLQLRVVRANPTLSLRSYSARATEIEFDGEWRVCSSSSVENGSIVQMRNTSGQTIMIAVEREEWDPDAVTAARVTAMQEFRDLFSSEVLSPGQQISVENLTLLFTDLGNSTALYERIGDAPAYGRVGAHFQYLVQHVKEHGGALVKTMGDAVMAVFFSPEEAVLSALSMLRDFPEFVRTHGDWDEVYLKVGVHHGPALAVNENEKLDYFGRTVNLAARLVSAASGPEIILTKEILEREGVMEVLDAQGTCRTSFSRPLRGVAQEMELVRVRLS